MNKIILTDCDGVLLNWIDPFLDHVGMTIDEFFAWEEDDRPEFEKVIRNFNKSARVGFLPTVPGAIQGVKALRNAGYEFHCITSFGGDAYSCHLRNENIRRYFDNAMTYVNILPLLKSKFDFLKENYDGKNYFYIEDCPKNAEAGLSVGLTPILLYGHLNKTLKPSEISNDIITAATWQDIVEIIETK